MSKNFASDDHRLASHLSGLLGKVLQHYEVDELSQIVLHELGHDDCFGLKKATYLIDNPDFNHLVGIAGYHNGECCYHQKDLWENPFKFKEDMKEANFNNNVKKFLQDSLRRKDIDLNSAKDIKDLGIHLGMEKPEFFSWNMKHGNHGILIFEQGDKQICEWKQGLLANVAALLSFCGI